MYFCVAHSHVNDCSQGTSAIQDVLQSPLEALTTLDKSNLRMCHFYHKFPLLTTIIMIGNFEIKVISFIGNPAQSMVGNFAL